ncbi:hypothetical protein T03_15154 [Trichinella britovi]|uniref:Uncharacterized protein n=1 Tax=Trichinella britovi TaxID=45882 RepID=A0A0V1DH64_TRIBR|nr:hypothetical protein T03_15154 [Trichinella britovi]
MGNFELMFCEFMIIEWLALWKSHLEIIYAEGLSIIHNTIGLISVWKFHLHVVQCIELRMKRDHYTVLRTKNSKRTNENGVTAMHQTFSQPFTYMVLPFACFPAIVLCSAPCA